MRPLTVVLLLLMLVTCCYADTIVAPDNLYIGNRFPFGQNGTVLYEQVYSSNLFSGPMDITALSFFIATYAGVNTGFADGLYYVGLSTTSKPVGG